MGEAVVSCHAPVAVGVSIFEGSLSGCFEGMPEGITHGPATNASPGAQPEEGRGGANAHRVGGDGGACGSRFDFDPNRSSPI